MGIFIWENGVAQPWQHFDGGAVVNYTAASEQITEEELLEILDKVCTIQGIMILHNNRLNAIEDSLEELKTQSEDLKNLYSAIKDIRQALLHGDELNKSGANRRDHNGNRR